MSYAVANGNSFDGTRCPVTGGEGNPIELDDSSTNSKSNRNSENENEVPRGPHILKQKKGEEKKGNGIDRGHNSEDGKESESDDGSRDGSDSGEDDNEENSESVGDDERDVDVSGMKNKSAKGEKWENEKKSDGRKSDGRSDDNDDDGDDDGDDSGEDEDGSGNSKNSATKARGKTKKTKNLWGNIESMSEIIKSPYEGNECAEVGEDCFEEFRGLMDCSETNGTINHGMVALVGDKLARDLCNAHHEIGKSGMLYSSNWKEGKIRDSDFGWIPKRQLLLCLHEHRFAKGDIIVLQAMTKNLDCAKLVLEAMKLWNLIDAYPNLASNKNEETFVFGVQRVLCCKCQIFVARAFATLQILNKTENVQQSLTKKIKACLRIMNEHVRVNQIELARMRKKADKKRKALQPSSSESPDMEARKRERSRKSETSGSRGKSKSSRSPGTSTSDTKEAKRKRRRKVPKCEEREESIFMLFDTMQLQVQRLNTMMSFFSIAIARSSRHSERRNSGNARKREKCETVNRSMIALEQKPSCFTGESIHAKWQEQI